MNKMFFAQNVMSSVLASKDYGWLYNWYAVYANNFAPIGWHIATKTDFEVLVTYLGGESVSGGKLKIFDNNAWDSPNTGANNSSGFSAIGTGEFDVGNGYTSAEKQRSFFWGYRNDEGWDTWGYIGLFIVYDSAGGFVSASDPRFGYSVRFVKNDSTNPGTVTDYDGNEYQCVTIGTQVWTTKNSKTTHTNSGVLIHESYDNNVWLNSKSGLRCAYNNDENNV